MCFLWLYFHFGYERLRFENQFLGSWIRDPRACGDSCSNFAAQLMDLAVRYWEGSVQIRDTQTGKPLRKGYLEMPGY